MQSVHLLIALQTSYAFDRNVFLSIANAAQAHGDIFLHPWQSAWPVQRAIQAEHVEGLIVSRSTEPEVNEVARLGLPCVNVANFLDGHPRVPVVGNDDDAIGEMIAEYFLNRGFKHFACVTDPDVAY